jgi:hypothetical protein
LARVYIYVLFIYVLSSRLLSKHVKIRIYEIRILPAVLYRCETWSLTLLEEHGLSVRIGWGDMGVISGDIKFQQAARKHSFRELGER